MGNVNTLAARVEQPNEHFVKLQLSKDCRCADAGESFSQQQLPNLLASAGFPAAQWDEFNVAMQGFCDRYSSERSTICGFLSVIFLLIVIGAPVSNPFVSLFFPLALVVGLQLFLRNSRNRNREIDAEIEGWLAQRAGDYARASVSVKYETQHTSLCTPKGALPCRIIVVRLGGAVPPASAAPVPVANISVADSPASAPPVATATPAPYAVPQVARTDPYAPASAAPYAAASAPPYAATSAPPHAAAPAPPYAAPQMERADPYPAQRQAAAGQTISVAVPVGAVAGSVMDVPLPEGGTLEVTVPPGFPPGSTIQVQY